MTKKLVLIRHGEAGHSKNGDDYTRTLTDTGTSQNIFIANKVLEKDCCPAVLLSSPATRALTTAQQFAKIWEIPTERIETHSAIYEAHTNQLLSIVDGISDEYQHAVIFGHNPGLSDLAAYYTGFQFQLCTSGALVLEFGVERWVEITEKSGKISLYLEP